MGTFSFFAVVDQLRVQDALACWDSFSVIPDSIKFVGGTVQCGYLPAVTPVGHSTLATGKFPADHGIHGRAWIHDRTTGAQHTVESVTATFEQIAGSVGALEKETIERITKTCPRFVSHILFDSNLCKKLPLGTFSIVASAKDFVSIILGGCNADVLIYPRLITRPLPQKYTQSALKVYCNPRKHLDQQKPLGKFNGWITGGVSNVIRSALEQMFESMRINGAPLTDLDRLKASIVDGGWNQSEGCHTFSFDFSGEFLKEAANNSVVDKMYTDISLAIAEEAARVFKDVAIIQSLYAADIVAHRYGVGKTSHYRNAVKSALDTVVGAIIRLNSVPGIYNDVMFCITTDHGGRDVHNVVDLHESGARGVYLGRFPLSIADANAHLYQEDFVAVYSSTQPETGGEAGIGLIDQGHAMSLWDIPAEVLDRSFPPSQRPDLLVVPQNGRIIRRANSPLYKLVAGGHGAAVDFRPSIGLKVAGDPAETRLGRLPTPKEGWHLSFDEQLVPVVLGTTRHRQEVSNIVRRLLWQSDVVWGFCQLFY
ncbi:alkaline phosphatase family protein [Polyangium sorediatum]|uniref:Alkaline phosphatase family protein n=1 Tax=Polyangium sorediatum TaxID=889274 RepID=A0ABT6P3I8_9BACT|nr:alkaline phosphatase family protein [Polyangium sorediatum]MDI1435176.1 alkaline phosphatase family protein [Polyangium sorediatum]